MGRWEVCVSTFDIKNTLVCKLSKVLHWLSLPILINHLKQRKHNSDTRLLCRKSIHDLGSATKLSENPLNDIGGAK
jgi:hypothetical protein